MLPQFSSELNWGSNTNFSESDLCLVQGPSCSWNQMWGLVCGSGRHIFYWTCLNRFEPNWTDAMFIFQFSNFVVPISFLAHKQDYSFIGCKWSLVHHSHSAIERCTNKLPNNIGLLDHPLQQTRRAVRLEPKMHTVTNSHPPMNQNTQVLVDNVAWQFMLDG